MRLRDRGSGDGGKLASALRQSTIRGVRHGRFEWAALPVADLDYEKGWWCAFLPST